MVYPGLGSVFANVQLILKGITLFTTIYIYEDRLFESSAEYYPEVRIAYFRVVIS